MEKKTTSPRLVSLDAFRGATIAAMILVNHPGDHRDAYWPLLHVAWDGWTPTDLVFPFFLFIVGLALTFSTRLEARPALVRAAKLFGLGLFLNAFPWFDLAQLRVPGVLQRIALCYLAAWAAKRWLSVRGQALLATALVGGYWLAMTRVVGPEGYAPNLEMTTNLAAQIDRVFLTGHMWRWTLTWDPEGVLSTLPAIATALLGLVAGEWLRAARAPFTKTVGFLAAGAVLCLAAVWWGEWAPAGVLFPINKSLWSPSFVLLTAGLGAAVFGLTYWLVDVNGWRGWAAPFVTFGKNAIALYVGSEALGRTLSVIAWGVGPDGAPFSLVGRTTAFFGWWLPPAAASLTFALATVLLWYFVARALDRRGIYVKV
jgi:predicted acyltransferase